MEVLLAVGDADFPLDLHLRRPLEIGPRYRWGDPYLREALDHGELLPRAGAALGAAVHNPTRNPVVQEWSERAERHWHMAKLLPDLPPGYLSGLFQLQRCLETYLRAALIAQQIPHASAAICCNSATSWRALSPAGSPNPPG